MPKLTLDPEMLAVESFAPDAGTGAATGTVRGHSFVTIDHRPCGGGDPTVSCEPSDYGWETCIGFSCLEKCAPSLGVPGCTA